MQDNFHLTMTLDGLGQRFNISISEHVRLIESMVRDAVTEACKPEKLQARIVEQAVQHIDREVERKIRIMLTKDNIQQVIDDAVDEVMARIFENEKEEGAS